MKLNSVLTHLVGKLKQLNDTYEGRKYLLSKGFKLIGAGCESVVFSRSGFEYVIKLMFDSHYKNDGAHIPHAPSEQHFVESLLIGDGHFPIVIQRKVESCAELDYKSDVWKRMEKFRKFVEKKWPNINDLGGYNIGMDRNGKFKIYDWTDTKFSQ